MTTPDELARKIILAARTGDGLTNVQDYAELLIKRRDEEVRQDKALQGCRLLTNDGELAD